MKKINVFISWIENYFLNKTIDFREMINAPTYFCIFFN